MEEKIGRDTLVELIQLQIKLLAEYKALVNTEEGGTAKEAKDALNEVVKAAIAAVGPILTLQHKAYDKAVGLHKTAVEQTGALLTKLLAEETARAEIHRKMREEADRVARERAEPRDRPR